VKKSFFVIALLSIFSKYTICSEFKAKDNLFQRKNVQQLTRTAVIETLYPEKNDRTTYLVVKQKSYTGICG